MEEGEGGGGKREEGGGILSQVEVKPDTCVCYSERLENN